MKLSPFGRRAEVESSAGSALSAVRPGLDGIVYGEPPQAVPESAALTGSGGSFFDKKVKAKELMQFSRQLAAFVRAGIPILDGLSLLAEDTNNPTMKRALADMEDSLRS